MRKTGTTTVSISISNANDNDPIFTEEVYTATVPENAGDGQFVTKVSCNHSNCRSNISHCLQVLAVDNDLGSFGIVYYSLVNGYDVFEISNETGTITTTESIDYEMIKSYSLTVIANDSATPLSTQRLALHEFLKKIKSSDSFSKYF